MGSYSMILMALAVGIFCLGAGMFISWLIRPNHPTPVKLEPYECGEPTVGSSQIQMRTWFYLIGLVFIVFDVEVIFLFPWAVVCKQLGWMAFAEMAVFLGVLLLALAYAWRKGVLKWQ